MLVSVISLWGRERRGGERQTVNHGEQGRGANMAIGQVEYQEGLWHDGEVEGVEAHTTCPALGCSSPSVLSALLV